VVWVGVGVRGIACAVVDGVCAVVDGVCVSERLCMCAVNGVCGWVGRRIGVDGRILVLGCVASHCSVPIRCLARDGCVWTGHRKSVPCCALLTEVGVL
jgi:hypothetical protein